MSSLYLNEKGAGNNPHASASGVFLTSGRSVCPWAWGWQTA